MKYLIYLVIAIQSFIAFAQAESAQGIWYGPNDEVPKYEWQGQWIWMNDSIQSDVLLARRTFEIPKIPEKVVLRISATSQYQLYINGKYLQRGPARSAPHHQSFDILDITSILQIEKNTIAVRVHQQKKKFSYHMKQRGGLLLQLDLTFEGKEIVISTNDDWKISPDLSWDSDTPVISRFQQIVSDQVDMRAYQNGWQTLGFDDSNWSNATVLKREVGWPTVQKNDSPTELTAPWTNLIPREVPYLKEEEFKTDNLVHAIELEVQELANPISISNQLPKDISKSFKKYLSKKSPLVIHKTESDKAWFLLFDLNEIVNGTPTLEIQGTSGTKIEVVGAPFMVNEKFTYKIVDSEYRDEIILSGKRDFWEATYSKPCRYLGIIAYTTEAPVKVFSIGTRQMKYPFKKKGFISSNEAPWVKQYMDATAKTIDACTTDAYTDNYRERRQYAQTGYYAALGNYYLFGDSSLQRRYLLQTAQEQQANGIIPAYAPAGSDDYMVILDSNCLWIRSLYNYLLYSGDFKTVKELLPSAKKLMQLINTFTNNLGMIDNPPYAYWLDHALLDRRGANFNLNGHYLGALDDFAKLLKWLEEPKSKTYKKRALVLRETLRSKFWNEEKQLFTDALIDGKQSNMYSEHANATAMSLNIATQDQAEKIAKQLLTKDKHNYIKRESGIIMVTPAMSYYLHKGLCEYGYISESFELFRSRFDKMLVSGTNGTLWEEWWLNGTGRTGKFDDRKTRSDAQTESAFPPALFAEYLLGINPIKPGMKEVEVRRTNSEIQKIEANVPSPEGNLFVKWDLNGGKKSLQLNVPGEMKVKLDLKSLVSEVTSSISIDGASLDQDVEECPYYVLGKGNHKIQF